MNSSKLPALALALGLSAAVVALPLTSARADEVEIAPMSDAAIQGAACLGVATASIAAAYLVGPVELLMLATGAQHIPSSSATLFIPMLSVLGGGTCAMAAAATPGVRWLMDQSDALGAQVASFAGGLVPGRSDPFQLALAEADAYDDAPVKAVPPLRPMTDAEVQGMGCVVATLGGLGAAMATSPSEVTMLSTGAVTVVSTTPVLAIGLFGTFLAATCGVGSLVGPPVAALVSNFSAIGDSVIGAITDSFTWAAGGAATVTARGVTGAIALFRGRDDDDFQVAEGGVGIR
jgi:hypothetical protein